MRLSELHDTPIPEFWRIGCLFDSHTGAGAFSGLKAADGPPIFLVVLTSKLHQTLDLVQPLGSVLLISSITNYRIDFLQLLFKAKQLFHKNIVCHRLRYSYCPSISSNLPSGSEQVCRHH